MWPSRNSSLCSFFGLKLFLLYENFLTSVSFQPSPTQDRNTQIWGLRWRAFKPNETRQDCPLLIISQAYTRVGLTSSSTAALIYKMSSCCQKHLQNTSCLSAVVLIKIIIQYFNFVKPDEKRVLSIAGINLKICGSNSNKGLRSKAEIFEYRFYSGPTSEST